MTDMIELRLHRRGVVHFGAVRRHCYVGLVASADRTSVDYLGSTFWAEASSSMFTGVPDQMRLWARS